MSTNPPQKVQDEALDLPLEERVRLAYKLLESLDKSLEKGGIKDSATAAPAPTPSTPETTAFRDDELQTGRAAAPLAPKAPEPVAAPAPEPPPPPPTYKIRFDDGSGVSIPVKLSLTGSRPKPTPTKTQAPVEATPQAAAPAAPPAAKPLPAIATSADLPAPEEVAAILDRLVPLNPAPAAPPAPRPQRAQTQPHQAAQPQPAVPPQQHVAPIQSHPAPTQAQQAAEATAAADTLGKAIDLAPETVAAGSLVKAPGTATDPFIDWELIPSADGNTELATQAPVLGVGLTFPAWKRTGVVATTVVGGVGAMAALVFAMQRPEASASDFTPAPAVVSAPATVSPPVTVAPPPAEPTPEPRTQAQGQEEEEPTRAAQTDRPPAVETPRAPNITIPTIPNLSERSAIVPPSRVGAPVVRLPTTGSAAPAGPVTSNQRLQLPQVRNASRVQQALERAYPIGLREVGIGGRVELAFYINEQGTVERFEVRQSSGNAALDQAALRVAPEFEFTPAQRGNSRVAGWFARGITFGNVVSAGTIAEVAAPDFAPSGTTGEQPVATQFDQPPEVRNAAQVRQALLREYPIGLRATGTGGRVEIWFYVNDRGVVERSQLRRSSGNQDLDRAALQVAQVFQFNPGVRGGSFVAGWISVPIVFDGAAPGPDSPDPGSDASAIFFQPS